MGAILDGLWIARPNHWNVGKSSGGAVEIAINFELEAWINPKTKEEVAPAQPQFLTGYFYPITKQGKVNENTMNSLKEALGWDGKKLGEFQATDWSNTRVKIVIGHEPDLKSRLKPKVQFINPITYAGNGPKPVDDKLISSLDDQFDSLLRAHASENNNATAPLAPQVYTPPTASPAVVPAMPAGEGESIPGLDDAWAAFCGASENMLDAERIARWTKFVSAAKASGIAGNDLVEKAKEAATAIDDADIPF